MRHSMVWGLKAWGIALLPTIVILFFASIARLSSLEADLATSAQQRLANAGQAWATAALSGRDAVLTGEAPSEDARQKALAVTASLFGLRILSDRTSLLPEQKPFTLSLIRQAGTLTLTGFVPDEATRASLLAEAGAAFPGAPVVDELKRARGAPAGNWRHAATLLLRELATLEIGQAGLSDARASISGTGKPGLDESSVRGALAGLPAGFTLGDVKIEAGLIKPYPFEARRGDGTLSLSGYVPSRAAQQEIAEAARLAFEGERIEDHLKIGPGAPPGFAMAAKAHLQDLARLAPGASLVLVDTGVALKGAALHAAAQEEIAVHFRQLLAQHPGYGGAAAVTLAPLGAVIERAPECQFLYSGLLARSTIRFAVASTEIEARSMPLLDRLAVITLRCAQARVEIGGHTDTDGSPQANSDLSRRRAEAVAQVMVKAGAPAERLEPVGYGETRPIAPNDSADNKGKNRRIEFNVK